MRPILFSIWSQPQQIVKISEGSCIEHGCNKESVVRVDLQFKEFPFCAYHFDEYKQRYKSKHKQEPMMPIEQKKVMIGFDALREEWLETVFTMTNIKNLTIREYMLLSHSQSVRSGFWDGGPRNIAEMLMLIVSEVAEGLEADRKDRHANEKQMEIYSGTNVTDREKHFKDSYDEHIKGSFEEELADILVRVFDLAAGLGIDLDYHLRAKIRYNAGREKLHGKKY